jgi:hypothetical protein
MIYLAMQSKKKTDAFYYDALILINGVTFQRPIDTLPRAMEMYQLLTQ